MSNNKFERFGKYLILDHLVDGGMAKICRARFLGEQANKVVAIKMVQPQFTKDPAFVQMFEDELKVTFGLLHPNIAQMYDYGVVNQQLYTAMEYVDGKNLKEFLDRLKEKNFVFPVEISTYIISQVCQALHYAHTFTDKLTGKPFNIIHRDISPHNIMLTYDGSIKVIDFGIAKADSNSEATQAGTIKGKLSYLAPEYLEGLDLDSRYDEFAVGITLWELLCSRKLFTAANDLAVLKQIQACKVPPPSSINPNVPKELDKIVMKALSKDRSQRYEDMDQFNRALVKFLYSNYPDFNQSDLSYFAKELFKEEITKDQEKFVEFGKIDIMPYLNDLKAEAEGSGQAVKTEDITLPGLTKKIELDFGLDKKSSSDIKLNAAPVRVSSGGTRRIQRPTDLKKSGGTQASLKRVSSDRTNTSIKRKSELTQEQSSGSVLSKLLLVASIMGFAYFKSDLVFEYTGYDIKALIHGNTASSGRNISSVEERIRNEITPEKKTGKVTFVGLEPNMQVYVNGQITSLQGIELELDYHKKHEIIVKKQGHKSFRVSDIQMSKVKNRQNIVIPPLERERVGLLSSSLNYPSGARLVIEIDGEKLVKNFPLRNERIPAGNYEAVIENPNLGVEKKVNLTIEENKKHFLD